MQARSVKHPGERVSFHLAPAIYQVIQAIAGKGKVDDWCRILVEKALTAQGEVSGAE